MASIDSLSRLTSAEDASASAEVVRHDDTRVTADQAAGTASIRTLGTGEVQAAPGNHTHSYQAADQDLTDIAALDSSTAGALATDGSGWIRKTYAQLKTALSLTKSDVGLANVTNDAQITKALLNAKGDLIAASADDTPARLPVGVNGQVLTADSSQANGIAWSDAGSSAPTPYTAVVPSGSTTADIVHNLGENDVSVTVRRVSDGSQVLVENLVLDNDTVRLIFTTAPTSNQYRVRIDAVTTGVEGGGGAVDSVSAENATILIGGTSSDPTVAVGEIAQSQVTGLVTDLAGKQASDADLTSIAALDSGTAGALATDGSGWIRKTYAQLKTSLALVKGDVGLGNVDNTSNATERAATATLTNKRITKRVGTTASSSSLTIDSDSYDAYTVTALAAAITMNNPSGTPTEFQPLLIRIKDNGTARALTWSGSQWRAVGITLPTTTVISKTLYVGAFWNSSDSKWDVTAIGLEA